MTQTAGAAAPVTTTPTAAPAPEMDSDGFSPAEREYFSSRGENVTGLIERPAAAPAAPKAPAQAAPASQQQEPAGDDDDNVDGEVTIDEQGRVKDARTGKFVPHAAYHKLREKYKAQRAKLEEVTTKVTRADERFSTLETILRANGMIQAPAPEAGAEPAKDETPPDPKVDMFGYMEWQGRQIQKLQKELVESRTKTEGYIGEQTYRANYMKDAARFMQEKPDFVPALNKLRESRNAELKLSGMADDKQRAAQVAAEERALVEAAIAAGRSPAETLYGYALIRGHQPKAAADPAVPNPSAIETHNKQIEMIANGQRQSSAAISNAGGASGSGLTMEALLAMSDEQYAATIPTLAPSIRRQLFGG